MASSVLENIKRTTQLTIDGYDQWDIDAIMAPRAAGCVYQALPQSLDIPARTNQYYREHYVSQILPLFQEFKVTVDSTLYDAEARKSMVHGFSSAVSPAGPYRMELCLILSFNEAGNQVVKMEEMFDSAYYHEFLAKLEAHMGSQGKEGSE